MLESRFVIIDSYRLKLFCHSYALVGRNFYTERLLQTNQGYHAQA